MTFVDIFDHEKMNHLEGEVIFNQKFCIKTMKWHWNKVPKLKNWLANVGQSHGCKKMNYLQRPFKHFLVFMVNQEMNTRTKLLVRMHGKKLQTGRILLKKVILLFFARILYVTLRLVFLRTCFWRQKVQRRIQNPV